MKAAGRNNGGAGARAGIRQVAEQAGVAISSVSRVLSNHPDVSDTMRMRVREAVAQLNYEPDILAQSLRRGSTWTIGFVISNIANPLFAEIAIGAELALQKAGYSVLIANSLGAPERDVSQIGLLKQRRVDGLILSLSDEEDPTTAAALKRLDKPFVLLDRVVRGLKTANSVLSDHAGGVRAAVAHLAGLGHRHIGFIGGSPRVRPSRERVAALQEACRLHGITASAVCGSYTSEYGEAAAAELLDGAAAAPPTALIAGSNQILVGVLKTLRRRQLEVPRDISLVTCDDLPLSEFLFVELATIYRDIPKLGTTAAELLLAALHGEPPREIMLPVEFRPGASCARPRPAL